MFARRLLQFINALIGVAALTAAGAVYWYVWRPLPDIAGSMSSPVSEKVSVDRDMLGVPHIAASNLEDLFFAQGFVTAQDRFWQMESFRRLTAGELAEIAGPAVLESDREFRRLRLSRIAEQRARSVSGEDRMVLAAYARGVNHYLETYADRLPVEFSLLRTRPRPWRIEDTMLVGLMMQHALSSSYRHDITREQMYSTGDATKVAQLFPARTGSEHQPGSNVWAVSGSRTASGKAALANDMHLGWSLPGVWYMSDLKAPGFHAFGVTIPGVPAVVVGRNEEIAWGITNLGFDVQDLTLPQGGRGVLERDRIAVKGADGELFEQVVDANGPLIPLPGGRRASLRWTAAENRPFLLGLVKLNRATNWQQFRDALREFPGAGSNVAYADRQGNIGLQVTGLLPIRRGCDGQRISAAGACEWTGFIPFEELPSFYNPAGGTIVSANQNPFPENYPYTVSGNFAPHYRANRILARLTKESKWTPSDMLGLQADIYSAYSHYLARRLVETFDRKRPGDAALGPAVDLLRKWNGEMRAELAAPAIVSAASDHLRKSIAAKASGADGSGWDPYIYFAVIQTLLERRPAGWFEDWDAMLLAALQAGVESTSAQQGSNPAKWQWGAANRLTIANPILRAVPWVGRYFQIGPETMDGSATTVKQTTARLGPSMRMVVDFGDPSGGLLNLPVGQSGQPLSRNYSDQWEAYRNITSFPMHFNGGWESRAALTLTPAGK